MSKKSPRFAWETKLCLILGVPFVLVGAILFNTFFLGEPLQAPLIARVLLFLSIPLFALSQIVFGFLLWFLHRLRGLPTSLTPGDLSIWVVVLILSFFVLTVINPFPIINRTKGLCSGSKKNWEIVRGEIANELDTVRRANQQGSSFTAKEAIRNVIWRHTSMGACTELVPGYCSGVIPNAEVDNFHLEKPALVYGIARLIPKSGQIALEVDPENPLAVIVYRDLSWEPVCGESASVQARVRVGE